MNNKIRFRVIILKILSIDTATDICGIALTEDKQLITEYRSNFKRAHAEKIIDSMARVLEDASLSLVELDCIAVSIGPGSFTGLRIGLSVVKGIAFANNLPLVSVVTLDALAYQALFWNGQICPIIKAQADEAYTALYKVKDFTLERICDYRLIKLNMLENFITEKTLVINNGMKNLNEYANNKLIQIAPEELSFLSGITFAQMGYEKFQNGDVEDIETLEPLYLKEFKVKKKQRAVSGL